MKIGLAVGHSRKGDEGAMTSRESGYSISEYMFNSDLVNGFSFNVGSLGFLTSGFLLVK